MTRLSTRRTSFRRLREAGPNLRARDIFRIVHDASVEVRSAVVYATLIVALVFLPVLTMSGVQGRLFAPLGTAYILAIVASLLVALTVTPALSYFLLPKATATAAETRFVVALKRRYVNVLTAISRAPRLIAVAAVALVILAAAAVPFLGGEFLPPLREGHYIVHMVAMPGTSLEESIRLGKLVTGRTATGRGRAGTFTTDRASGKRGTIPQASTIVKSTSI